MDNPYYITDNHTVPIPTLHAGELHVPAVMGLIEPILPAAERAAAIASGAAESARRAAVDAATFVRVGNNNPGHIVTTTPHGSSATTAFSAAAQAIGKAVSPPQHQKAPSPPTSPQVPAAVNNKIGQVTGVPHAAMEMPTAATFAWQAAQIAPTAPPMATSTTVKSPAPPIKGAAFSLGRKR